MAEKKKVLLLLYEAITIDTKNDPIIKLCPTIKTQKLLTEITIFFDNTYDLINSALKMGELVLLKHSLPKSVKIWLKFE